MKQQQPSCPEMLFLGSRLEQLGQKHQSLVAKLRHPANDKATQAALKDDLCEATTETSCINLAVWNYLYGYERKVRVECAWLQIPMETRAYLRLLDMPVYVDELTLRRLKALGLEDEHIAAIMRAAALAAKSHGVAVSWEVKIFQGAIA